MKIEAKESLISGVILSIVGMVISACVLIFAPAEDSLRFLLMLPCCILFLVGALFIYGRKTEFDEQGYTVKLLFIKRFYSWESIATKIIFDSAPKAYAGRADFSVECVILRRKKVKKPGMRKFMIQRGLAMPLDFVFMTLVKGENKKSVPYSEDKELFHQKIEEWGIEFERIYAD